MPPLPRLKALPQTSPDEMLSRLERTLASSPADATELVWIETRRAQESTENRRRGSPDQRDEQRPEQQPEQQETTVLVRVRESGRYGLHRTTACEPADLSNAVRQALAQARLSPLRAAVQSPGGKPALLEGLHDPEIARLTPGRARDLVQRLAGRDETLRLGWSEGRMAVANSRGMRRAAEVTAAWIAAAAGRGPGAGTAAAAARSLDGLNPEAVIARARGRQAPSPPPGTSPAPLPAGPVSVVLSQEAVAALLDLLNHRALTSTSFRLGTSPLRNALGAPVFHPAISLRDDALAPHGLPFPFDLLGSPRRRIELISEGLFLTPAVDELLGLETDRPTTAQLVAMDEAMASHLVLVSGVVGATGAAGAPGETIPDAELLARADGGIWISALDRVEAYDPGTLRFRAAAGGVRRIEDGRLGAALPDLVWEDDLRSLLGVSADLLGVGSEPVTVGESLFGGITAPILGIGGVSGFRG